jgi:hypothetical protein
MSVSMPMFIFICKFCYACFNGEFQDIPLNVVMDRDTGTDMDADKNMDIYN